LQPLDLCKSLRGNARKRFSEKVEAERKGHENGWIPLGRNFEAKGKTTLPFPSLWQRTVGGITADQLEGYVIQRGAEMINDLSGEDCNTNRRPLGKANLLCSIHLVDDKIRYALHVSGSANIQRLQMLPRTDHFALR
jgi:hypothetical protein